MSQKQQVKQIPQSGWVWRDKKTLKAEKKNGFYKRAKYIDQSLYHQIGDVHLVKSCKGFNVTRRALALQL